MDNNYCMDIDSDCTHIKAMRGEITTLREKLRVAEEALEYYTMGGSNYIKMAVEALAKIREVK